MVESVIENTVRTMPSQGVPDITGNRAVSFSADFDAVKHLISECPPQPRPNRTIPIHDDERSLQEELSAWNAASDEAFESLNDGVAE